MHNLQNLHSTNWLRVLDIILFCLFLSVTAWSTETLPGFMMARIIVGVELSDISRQFNLVSRETVLLRGLVTGEIS